MPGAIRDRPETYLSAGYLFANESHLKLRPKRVRTVAARYATCRFLATLSGGPASAFRVIGYSCSADSLSVAPTLSQWNYSVTLCATTGSNRRSAGNSCVGDWPLPHNR